MSALKELLALLDHLCYTCCTGLRSIFTFSFYRTAVLHFLAISVLLFNHSSLFDVSVFTILVVLTFHSLNIAPALFLIGATLALLAHSVECSGELDYLKEKLSRYLKRGDY